MNFSILDNFILADESFSKVLHNNICGKLFSSLESLVTFD